MKRELTKYNQTKLAITTSEYEHLQPIKTSSKQKIQRPLEKKSKIVKGTSLHSLNNLKFIPDELHLNLSSQTISLPSTSTTGIPHRKVTIRDRNKLSRDYRPMNMNDSISSGTSNEYDIEMLRIKTALTDNCHDLEAMDIFAINKSLDSMNLKTLSMKSNITKSLNRLNTQRQLIRSKQQPVIQSENETVDIIPQVISIPTKQSTPIPHRRIHISNKQSTSSNIMPMNKSTFSYHGDITDDIEIQGSELLSHETAQHVNIDDNYVKGSLHTDPLNPDLLQRQKTPIRRMNISCCKCVKPSSFWCQSCAKGYCYICWPTMRHHRATDLRDILISRLQSIDSTDTSNPSNYVLDPVLSSIV